MKIGDKLYCHRDYGKGAFDTGNTYIVEKFVGQGTNIRHSYIVIRGDNGKIEALYTDKGLFTESYHNWFYTENEYRKLKLEKLMEQKKRLKLKKK